MLVPNATEFQHFRFSSNATPAELANVQHPIVGYYGAISEWFDTSLVAFLARRPVTDALSDHAGSNVADKTPRRMPPLGVGRGAKITQTGHESSLSRVRAACSPHSAIGP